MPVSTVVVVGGGGRVLFAQDAGRSLRGFLDVGAREDPGAVRRFARHAGIDVPEELDPVDAEDRGGASVSVRARSPSDSSGATMPGVARRARRVATASTTR
jgi:hypothetical protein